VAVEPGTTIEAWIEAYCAPPCAGMLDRAVATSMDGHAGLLVPSPATDDTQAFFLVDDRMYVVAAWQGEFRLLLEAFLSTMRLLAGGPALAASSPPPA
jgi:hypothetical protein